MSAISFFFPRHESEPLASASASLPLASSSWSRQATRFVHEEPPILLGQAEGARLYFVTSQALASSTITWLRIHFTRPRDVSYASPMPPYAYLFRNGRGEDLVAYLASLNDARHWDGVAQWQPAPAAWQQSDRADGADGERLFAEHCATCHSPGGAARTKWASSFHRVPPDLARDALQHVTAADPRTDIARIAKFGIQGTDMPGREYLPDDEITAIAAYVARQRASAAGAR